MSVVTSPFRSSFGPSSYNGPNTQGGSVYPSLPNQQNQLQRYGQTQSQVQYGGQQHSQQQQLQQSTSFGPISHQQPQQPPQQQPPSSSYGYQTQHQVGTYNANVFSNTFSFGPQQLAALPSGKSEEEVRLGELSLAGDKVGRGMSADEEISGDLADMMANGQAASKPDFHEFPERDLSWTTD